MPKISADLKRKLPKRQIKVLYVCPFAHYPGHFTWASARETKALSQAGIEVALLTSSGVIDEAQLKVPSLVVFPRTGYTIPLHHLASFLRRWGLSRWLLMFFETVLTLSKAVQIKRKFNYDIIHLRDGEPFLFLPHLLSLPFRGCNWAIWLTASNIYPPPAQNFQLRIYRAVIKFINSSLWRPLYHASLARNSFVFLTENEKARQDYNSYLGGIFAGKVVCLPLGAGRPANKIPKSIFLSFGAPHSGKDVETIFRALSDLPDVCLVHAGTQAFGLGTNTENLVENYVEPNRMIIRDYYIPEEEKPYYFFAADAMILSYKRHFLSTSSLLWETCRFETPVISSDNGQLVKLVESYNIGLLFKAQNTDSLRKAIIRFMNLKPEEIEVLKDNCRRFATEFSIDKWADRCLEIYNSLLTGGGRANSTGRENSSDDS
jgi:glycosyltransferase involved in cell wall biosynthesis